MDGGSSPFPPASPGSDLASKYTKLASEYSKMRTQSGVLKKAVVEEQMKISELNESLRQRDQTIRKYESEMESINFRNQQLSKRVEILQDELETNRVRETTGKKGSRDNVKDHEKVHASENFNSVFSEELQLKIEENTRLHHKLAEIDKVYELKIQEQESRIHELESRLSKIQQSDRAEDAKQKELINALKMENVSLQTKLQELSSDLADKNDRITVLQVQLESSACSNGDQFSQKRYSNPGTNSNYLILNSTEARVQTVEVLSLLGEGVQEFVAAMSDLHTYWEHRLKDTRTSDGQWSCETAGKLSSILLQNVKHLKPIEESYQQVLSDILSSSESGQKSRQKFSKFSEHFSFYVKYATQQVEPLLIDCLRYESNSSLCSPTQQAKNGQFQTCLRNFDLLLVRLAELLGELVAEQEPGDQLVENINVTVSKLHRQSVELFNVYSSKSADENNLPTVNRQLINTNQCIVTSLSNLSATLNNLSHNLSDNSTRLAKLLSVNFDEDKRLTDVVETESLLLNLKLEADLETQLSLRAEESKVEIGNLKHEIESLNEKLKKAVQDKEHWKLECQLLQMKHDKIREKDSTAESSFETANTDEVKQMFETKLESLVSEKLEADSKAAHFFLECVALQKRVKGRERAKQKAEEDLAIAEEQIRIIRDEMGLTTTNYEGQLSLMSEHVASMNDKLASQTDQIERLKYELNLNGKRK